MLYLWIVSIIWAFSFGLIKTYMVGINPYYLAFLRLGIAFLFFLPFLRIKQLNFKLFIKYLGIGAVQFGMMYIFYLQAYRYLPAWQIALFTITTPIYVTLINDVIIKKFDMKSLAAALLSVVGAFILKSPKESIQFFAVGFILVQLANISFALGQIGYKRVSETTKLTKNTEVFAVLYFGGVLTALIGLLFFGGDVALRLSKVQMSVLLYLGVVASGICFFLWNIGARKSEVGILAIMNNMKIPVAILASVIIFGEQLILTKFVLGVAILLVGFLFLLKKRKLLVKLD